MIAAAGANSFLEEESFVVELAQAAQASPEILDNPDDSPDLEIGSASRSCHFTHPRPALQKGITLVAEPRRAGLAQTAR